MRKNRYLLQGIQLLELLITIFIISILFSFSFPLYSQYLIRGKRLTAEKTLLALSLAIETYRIENNTNSIPSLAQLNFPTRIDKNTYRLAIETLNNEYRLIAQPLNQQAVRDMSCGELILMENGEKQISGTGKVGECW